MSGKPIVVLTGATGRIGRVLTAGLLADGQTVVALARRESTLADLAAEHPDTGQRLFTLPLDFAAADCVDTLTAFLASHDLAPTGLVNNARSREFLGVGHEDPGLADAFAGELRMGLIVPFQMSMALACRPGSRLDSIVNISSMYGLVAPNLGLYETPEQVPPVHYGVTKAGQLQLTRELAVRLAGDGVRVNAVSYAGVAGRADAVFEERYARLAPMGRMLEDAELTGPVRFLLSAESTGTTGQNLVVDGGWTAW